MDLESDLLIEHGRRPRRRGSLANATHHAEVTNPLCQDTVILHLLVENENISDIRTEGESCAICTASTSLMAESVVNKTTADAIAQARRVREAMKSPGDADLGELNSLLAIRAYPMRVKCVTLPWHALAAALNETL